MRYLGNLILAIAVLSGSIRASPITFLPQQQPQHNKIIYKDDGTIDKIIKPDGTILPGASGVICTTRCPKIAQESLREEKDNKKIIAGILIGGAIIACAVLCRGSKEPPPITVVPPTVPPISPPEPTNPVPEPSNLMLSVIALGCLGYLKRKGREG